MSAYASFGADVSAGMLKYGGDLFDGGCGCSGKFLGGQELVENIADYDKTANAATNREIIGKHDAALDKLLTIKPHELKHGKFDARLDKINSLQLSGRDRQRKAEEYIVGAYSGAAGITFASVGQVADYLKNLGLGAGEQFAAVKTAIGAVVENIKYTCKKTEEFLGKLEEVIKNCSETDQVQMYIAAMKETLRFGRQQLAAFDTMFSSFSSPNTRAIDDLVYSTWALDDVYADLGTKEYAEKLRAILTLGALNTEKLKIVDEALKQLGTSANQAIQMGIPKLNQVVAKALEGKGKESYEPLLKLHKLITKNFPLIKNRPITGAGSDSYEGGNAIPEFYEGGNAIPSFYSGGSQDIEAYFAGSTVPTFYTGGVREFNDQGTKTKIEREIVQKKKVRAIILSAFASRLADEFDKCMQALHVIAVKIGTEIPLSDNLDSFRGSLVRLGYVSMTNPDRLYALCGYFNDSTSKSIKEDFVGQLKTVNSYIDTLVEMNDYRASAQYFKSLQENIKAVIATVDKFTEEIKQKFGAGEIVPAFYDGGDAVESIKPDFAPRYKSPKNFATAVQKFDYYYKSAQIKRNLSVAGKDIETYSKDYPNLVAKSIATILQEEQNKYDTLREKLKLLEKYQPNLPAVPGHTTTGWDHAEIPQGLKGTKPEDNTKWLNELDAASKLLDQAWDTKKRFWRTVEALDLYMKAFTDGIVNNPQDIRDIKSMLDDIPVVSDVYSKKSGEHLTEVFDSFPRADNIKEWITNGQSYYATPPDKLRKHGTKHYYEALSDETVCPGNHMISQLPSKIKESKDAAAATFRNLYYLKNLISVFTHIGSKFGGSELRSKISLTPTHIYDNLVNYLQNSAYSIGFGTGDIKTDEELNSNVNMGFTLSRDPTVINWARPKDFVGHMVYGNYIQPVKGWVNDGVLASDSRPMSAGMKLFGTWMRTCGFEIFDGFSFKVEDDYFVLIMKSICAKIFTVTGTYDVFDRPMEYNGLSAVRMILGGADETPKIDDAAVELYLRLPLLLEFYKKIFGYDEDRDFDVKTNYPHKYASSGLKISMVPDVEGVFADLIKIIFRDSRFVKTRAYSDDTVAAIVREVNAIYQKMAQKYPAGEVVHKTIMELVNEVNRRYGVLSKHERDDYEKDLNRGNDYSSWTKNYGNLRSRNDPRYDDDSREYAILPDEGLDGDSQVVSRAEMMLDTKLGSIDPIKSRNKYRIMPGHKEILYRFRCMVEKQFNNTNESFSFANTIKAARGKLKAVTNDAERFNVICSLVRGRDVTTSRDSMVWLLFHETVVLGLNTLSVIHSLLYRFKMAVIATDVEKVCEFFANAGDVSIDEYGKYLVKHIVHDALGVGEFIQSITNMDYVPANSVAADKKITSATGPLSIINGMDIKVLKFPQTDESAKIATLMLFDSPNIMKLLVESMFAFGNDLQGLVSVKVDQGSVNISFNGLKTLIGDLFESVNYFIDVLRPHLPIETVDKYLDKETPGSYWWLHEQIMEKIIIGRDKLIGDNDSKEYVSLDRLNERLSSTWRWLTQDTSKFGINDYDLNATIAKGRNIIKNNFGDVFADLVYYGFENQLRGVDGNESKETASCVDFLSDPYESLHFSGQLGAKTIDTRFVARFKSLYSFDEEFSSNKSALFGFNQLVAKFIKQFYDTSVQKMYQGLIQPFAGSNLNQAVLDYKQTYPDIVPVLIGKGFGGESYAASPSYNISYMMTDRSKKLYSGMNGILKALYKADPSIFTDLKPIRGGLYDIDPADCVTTMTTHNPFGGYKDNNWPLTKLDMHYIVYAQAILDSNVIARIKGDDNLVADDATPILGCYGAMIESIVKRYTDQSIAGKPASLIVANEFIRDYTPGNLYKLAIARGTMYRKAAESNFEQGYPSAALAVVGGFAPRSRLYPDELRSQVELLVMPVNSADSRPSGLLSKLFTSIPSSSSLTSANANEIIDQTAAAVAVTAVNLDSVWRATKREYRAAAAPADQSNIIEGLKSKIKALYEDIGQAILSPPKGFAPGPSGAPRYSAKYDEIITMSTSVDVVNPTMSSAGTLVMARHSAVNGILDANSINSLGAQGTSTTTHDTGKFGVRGDPDSDHVLFSSLSAILRNLLTSRTANTQAYVYLQDNVADITFHMKEKMRANLPAFKAMFSALINRCEFIKHVSRNLTLDRSDPPTIHNPWPFVLKEPVVQSNDVRVRQHGILDTIIRGCTALVSACDKTLMEIGDEPKFMELYQNAIKDYRTRNGIDPFAPLSTLGTIFKNIRMVSNPAVAGEVYTTFLPVHQLGSDSAKFLYGTRALLHKYDAPSLAHAPGFVSTMDYASMTVPGVEKRKVEAFFSAAVRGARYINEVRHFKNILNAGFTRGYHEFSIESSFCACDVIITDSHITGPISNQSSMSIICTGKEEVKGIGANGEFELYKENSVDHIARPIYQTRNSLQDIVQLTESSFRDEQIRKIVEHIAKSIDENKTDLDVLNIIDLNIVPINVHALMRDIPLANLYNYAYTCDRMIIELFYGLKNKNAQKLMDQLCDGNTTSEIIDLTSAKDMLVALLLHPYRDITHDNGDLVHQMFVGATAIDGLGRPKFISDQIYNSAIFGQMYKLTGYSEIGPQNTTKDFGKPLHHKFILKVVRDYAEQFTRGFVGSALAAVDEDARDELVAAITKDILLKPTLTVSEVYNNLDFRKIEPLSATDPDNANIILTIIILVRIITFYLMIISNEMENNATVERIGKLVDSMYIWSNIPMVMQSRRSSWKDLLTRDIILTWYNPTKSLNKKFKPTVDVYSALRFVLPFNGVSGTSSSDAYVDEKTSEQLFILLTTGANTLKVNKVAVPLVDDLMRVSPQVLREMLLDYGKSYIKPAGLTFTEQNLDKKMKLHYIDNDSNDDAYPPSWSSRDARSRPDNVNVVSPSQKKHVELPKEISNIVINLAALRLDSRFIRNLIFIVNLYRAVRVKMQRDLVYDREVIQRSAAITKDSITEFFGNEVLGDANRDWVRDRNSRYGY